MLKNTQENVCNIWLNRTVAWLTCLSVLQDVGRSHSDESDESDDSDSDNFSVEFEVESIDSDAYSENDEDSVPGEDEVWTLFCAAAALV